MTKVEIKPDVTNESLEQSAEKVSKDGVDVSKDVNISTDGTTATVTPKEVQEEKPISESVRPNWLPEKFANAEELAKAYGELEKQFSSRTPEEKSDVSIPETSKEEDSKRVQSLDKYYNQLLRL